jgi:cobyrinic acid a,c-diamide synthase
MPAVPRLVISAVRGGLGKTTLSLGITAAWSKQGRRIAVFKKGPDFIDAGWLGVAAGSPCYNLDLYMMEQARMRQ